MKDYFNNYLIVGQVISFLLVPPLVAFIVCHRLKTNTITLVLSVVGCAVFGIVLCITFLINLAKKNEKNKQKTNKI